MEVGQAHPLGVGHSAEMGMRLPVEVSGLAREAVYEVLQVAQIGGEIGGGRAAGLLVQLGRGFVSPWAMGWEPRAPSTSGKCGDTEGGRGTPF